MERKSTRHKCSFRATNSNVCHIMFNFNLFLNIWFENYSNVLFWVCFSSNISIQLSFRFRNAVLRWPLESEGFIQRALQRIFTLLKFLNVCSLCLYHAHTWWWHLAFSHLLHASLVKWLIHWGYHWAISLTLQQHRDNHTCIYLLYIATICRCIVTIHHFLILINKIIWA